MKSHDSTHKLQGASGKVPGGGEVQLLQFGGLFLAAAAIGLGLGATRIASLGSAVVALQNQGIGPSTLFVAGVVLFGLARVRRGQHLLHRAVADGNENELLLEQLATDMVQLRNAIDHLRNEEGAVRDEVRAQGQRAEVITQMLQAQAEKPEDNQHDALFRLAASLDQMGARIETNLQAQYETFQAGLQQVAGEILSAQDTIRRALSQLPEAAVALKASGPSEERFAAQPELTDSAFRRATEASTAGSLGVLDGIDDDGVTHFTRAQTGFQAQPNLSRTGYHAAQPNPPAVLPGVSHPSAAQTGFRPLAATAAAPAGESFADGARLTPEKTPAMRAAELETQTKLMQLNDLLTDDRLRAALDQIRRGD